VRTRDWSSWRVTPHRSGVLSALDASLVAWSPADDWVPVRLDELTPPAHACLPRVGLCDVHVNTMEGFWSLLRSWLRPHRGISQEKRPLSLSFFAFVHNVRRRGKALLGALIELLVC
jgi:hypothetical protein